MSQHLKVIYQFTCLLLHNKLTVSSIMSAFCSYAIMLKIVPANPPRLSGSLRERARAVMTRTWYTENGFRRGAAGYLYPVARNVAREKR